MSRIIRRKGGRYDSQGRKCSRQEKQQVDRSRGMASLRDVKKSSPDGQENDGGKR